MRLLLEVYPEYAALVDRGEIAAWAAMFSPDAVMISRGQRLDGRAEIEAFLLSLRQEGVPNGRLHFITNVRARLLGEHEARLKAYYLVAGSGDDGRLDTVMGTYDTTLRWSGDRWLLTRHEVDFVRDRDNAAQ